MAIDWNKAMSSAKKKDEESYSSTSKSERSSRNSGINWERALASAQEKDAPQLEYLKKQESKNTQRTGYSQQATANGAGAASESNTSDADARARAFVNSNRGKETAYLGTGTNGSTAKVNYVVTTKGASTPVSTENGEQAVDVAARNTARQKATQENKTKAITRVSGSKSQLPGDARSQDTGVHVATDESENKAEQITELNKNVANEEFFKSDIDRKSAIANSRERVSTEYTEKYNNMSADSKALLSFINREEEAQVNINWMGVAAALSGQPGSNAAAAGQYAASLTTSQEARRMLRELYGMTDDEIDAAVILHERSRNAEIAQRQDAEMRKFEQEHPVLSSAASVPMSVAGTIISPLGTLESYEDVARAKSLGMGDIGLDKNNMYRTPINAAKSIRDEFTATHDLMIGDYDVADMLYNTTMSGADSFAAGVVGGGFGGVILGAGAATDTAQELSDRGISTEKAIFGGAMAGVFEGVFESLSIGNLKAFKNADVKTIKDAAKNIGKSVVVNASEETLTEIANITYDTLANGGLSEYKLMVAEYSKTMPKEKAEKKARTELALRVAESGASGALMGLGFGGGGSATSYASHAAQVAVTGKAAKDKDMSSAVIAEGQAAPEGSESKRTADKLAKAQAEGKKVGGYKLGRLAELNAELKENEGGESETVTKMQDAFNEKLHKELADIDAAKVKNPTIKTENGTVKVEGDIYKTKDGENAVKTADGKEVKVSELITQLQDKNVARLYEKTQELSAEAANLFISNYNGETIDEYKRAFDYYYKMGRTGMNIEDIRKNDSIFGNYLTAEAQAKIANAGLYDREFKKGFTDLSVGRKNERYRFETRVLQALGENKNLEIFVIDEDSNYNGSYLSGTNRIVIRRNAEGKLLLRTAGHEALHFIKNQATDDAAKAEVKALEDFVLDAMKKNGEDVEAEIRRLGELTNNGEQVYKTREECIEEIVANGMFDVFTNEKTVKNLMNENRSLFDRMANKVKKIIADIRRVIAVIGNNDAAIRALKDDVEALDKINATFDSLLTKAGEKYKAEHGAGQKNNAEDSTARFSVKNITITQDVFDENIKKITLMESVSDLTGTEFAKSDVGLPNQVEQFFASFNNSIENSEIGDVELTKRGAKDSIAHGIGRKKAVSFAAVPKTIKNGKIIDFQSNWKGRGYDTVVLAAPITISGERYYQGVIVLREKTSQRFYVHEVLTEKESDTSFKTGVGAKHTPGDVSPSLISLLKKLQNVNNNSKRNLRNDAPTQKFSAKSSNSTKQTSPIQAHYAEVIRENRNFKQILSLLGEMQYSSVSGNVHLNSKDIDRIAREIIKSASSKYDRTRFANELTVLYDYMANGGQNADTEEIYTNLLNIANNILEQSEIKDTELYDQYKEVRDFLRTQPIYITPAVKKEIESQFGDYKSFRNLLMGKVMHMSTTDSSARTLDEVWQELSEMAPEYFPKDMNELDMPMQLGAFYEAIAPKVVNPYEHFEENLEDAAVELATEIHQKFYEVGRLKTTQEEYRNLVFENMKKLEDSKKAMRQEFKKKTAEGEQNYRQRVAEYKQQREQGDRRRRLKNELERNYNYLNRRIVRETDNDHIPKNLKKVVSAFRFIVPDGNSYFSKARFTEFENEYRKLEETSSFFDADIADRISALKERLTPGIGAPKMRDLDNYELEELRNISEHVKYIVQNENRLFSDRLKGRVENFAKAVHNELAVRPESKAQGVPQYNATIKDKARNSVDSFIKGLTKPEYLFDSFGSDTLKELYDELRRGENTEARMITDAKAAEQEIKKRYNYDPRWEKQNITIDFASGKLTMTVEQAMALYTTSKRKQGLEHMLNGGVLLYTSNEIAKKNGKTKTNIKRSRHKFNESDIPKLQSALTNEQKNYVNAMVEYITKDIGSKRNEVSLKLNGIEKYKENYYFPIKVDRNFVDTSIGRQEVVSTIKNQSSAKRTVNHAHNPIEITGFTETVNQHIYDSALYCSYVLPINDFKRVYNFRDTVFEGEGVESLIRRDLSVKEDIRRTNGANAIRQIEDFMIALDSGSRYENLMPLSAKLAAKAKKVSVMANLSVVVQQPTAVFRAMLYVNPKHFKTWASKADIAEMKKWNGCVLKKEIGYFDVNMGRTATDYINEYSPDKAIKKDWGIGDYLENGNVMLTIDQIAGWGATKTDEMTWGAIWKACKKQTKAENAELSGDALNEAAAELFQKVISKTQVYDSVFTKPDYMRRKEGFAMMATQFMSEPLTSLNMLAEAVVNARNAKGSNQQKTARKFCARAFACYMTSLVVNSALKSLVYTMRDDDEENSFLEKYVANVTEGIATDPIGMFPYLKDIFSIVQGYDLNRTDVAVFSSFKDAIDALGSEKKGAYDKIMAVLKAAGQASGIPAYAVIRDGKAILNAFDKIVDGVQNGFEPTTGKGVLNELRETFEWIPGVEADSKYEQLYKAIVDGDDKHYKKINDNLKAEGKDENTINDGIAGVLEMYEPRIATAYNAVAQGNAAQASEIVSELEKVGFERNIINKALRKYENNLKKKLDDDERIAKAAEARYNMDFDEYERIIDELVAEGHSAKIVKDKINSEKIEIETKANEFTVEEKNTYIASYDLKNAMINGTSSEVRAVHGKLVREAGSEEADSEVRKYAKEAFMNGEITESQARMYLEEYRAEGDDDNDVFWQMEELKGGDGYEKYGKLYDAIDNGRNLSGTVSYYTEHGVELKTVKSNITKEYKSKLTSLTSGTAEYNEMYNNVIDAFVAAGDSESDAVKKVNKWFE